MCIVSFRIDVQCGICLGVLDVLVHILLIFELIVSLLSIDESELRNVIGHFVNSACL